jgi:beta-glucosidase
MITTAVASTITRTAKGEGGRMGAAFPKEFLWGTAQSGHSIEGGNFASDWWRWEQRAGRVAGRATSEEAAHFFENYHKDLDLARDFGHNAFLLALEWSRIQPEPDTFDEAAIEVYRGIFEALGKRNLEPVCALHHVTLPRWFAEGYSWHHADAPKRFGTYAARVIAEFAPFCRWWLPIREPEHALTMGYYLRRWPGPERGWLRAGTARRNLARAHAEAYEHIHAAREDAQVGASVLARRLFPGDPNSPWDVRACLREGERCNHAFVRKVTIGEGATGPQREFANTADFIGVAYYGREHLRLAPLSPQTRFARSCDAQGRIIDGPLVEPDADGLVDVLRELSVYKLPLLVTGNGLGTEDDSARCAHLTDHAAALRRAREEGLDVRGYLHRALLDGFEWHEGYAAPYGLIHVDRQRQTRRAKPSAAVFRDIIKANKGAPERVKHR